MKEEKLLNAAELLEMLTKFREEIIAEIRTFSKEDKEEMKQIFHDHGIAMEEERTDDFYQIYLRVKNGEGTAEEIKQVKQKEKEIKDLDNKLFTFTKYFELRTIFMGYEKGYNLEDLCKVLMENMDVKKMRKDGRGIPN